MVRIFLYGLGTIAFLYATYIVSMTSHLVPNGYYTDKALHCTAFTMIMLMVTLKKWGNWKFIILCISLCLLLGIGTELMQHYFSTNRKAQWSDMAANLTGIFLGVLIGYLIRTGYYAQQYKSEKNKI